jgi:hypothetical protein
VVKKRPRFFSLLGLLDERASSARFSHATARRLGPRRAATGVIDSCGNRERDAAARFCSHLAFPARDQRNVRHCGRIARNHATACCPRLPELCFWFRICAFHREAPINGVRKHALVATACLVACFGGVCLVDSDCSSYVCFLATSHWCDTFRKRNVQKFQFALFHFVPIG